MAIQDVWFSNLKALVEIEGGGRRGIRAVADLSGLSEEYVYQLVSKKPNSKGIPREIGKEAAGKISKAFANGKSESWFDTPQEAGISNRRKNLQDSDKNQDVTQVSHAQDTINNIASLRPILAWEHPEDLPSGDYVLIPRLDVHLSAGNGREQVALDLVKDTPQAFRAEWIREMRIKPAKLASMRANGDSMEPRIFDGDAVVVDTGDTNVLDGKVYAVWYDGGERIKRLYRLPGRGLRIISDNDALYPKIDLNEEQSQHVRVLGRVRHVSSTQGL